VTVTAPVAHGCRVIEIQFPPSKGDTTLVYPTGDNLDGAVFCITSFMLNGDGLCKMEMKPINKRTGAVDEQFTWASWNLTPSRANKDGQDEVHQQVKKIVAMLFCESRANEDDVMNQYVAAS